MEFLEKKIDLFLFEFGKIVIFLLFFAYFLDYKAHIPVFLFLKIYKLFTKEAISFVKELNPVVGLLKIPGGWTLFIIHTTTYIGRNYTLK